MNHRYRPTVSTWLKRLAALALSLAGTAALAQAAWPSKPIKLVVPYGAGSSPDVIARIMGEKLATRLGQPVIVENRVGGGGNNGTGSVAKSPGDGYTYVISTNGPLVYNTVLYKKLPYDPFTELRPVVLAGGQANVCTVRADSGINSLQELVAAMKKNPGKFNFSSTGVGSLSQLGVELLKVKTDTYAVHIPYASSPLAVLAIPLGLTYGPQAALYAEMFPAKVRYSGVSIGYALGSIFGGAFAAMIAQAIITTTKQSWHVGLYVAVMALISLVAVSMVREQKDFSLHAD